MTSPRSSIPAALASVLFLATPAPAGDDDVIVTAHLANTGLFPGATAEARWRDKGDAIDFQVEIEDAPSGSYAVSVGGVPRGTVSVGAFGQGEVEWKAPLDPPKPLLDFDVLGAAIEVSFGGDVVFSDVFPGSGGGPGPGPGGGGGGQGGNTAEIELFMTPTGVDLDAKGRLRHRVKSGTTRFDTEFQRLDAGGYVLRVGGLDVASFTASGAEFEEIEIEFRDPPEPGHVPLTFDPLGQSVELVRGGDTVVLTAVMPGDPSTSGVKPPKSPKQAARDVGGRKRDALSTVWGNTGGMLGAQGELLLERVEDGDRLDVAADGLTPGDYSLLVDSVVRATTTVGADGRLDLAFDAPLAFAVKGRLVELRRGADDVLAVAHALSVQHALDAFVKEKTSTKAARRNLVNAGVDLDARGVVVRRTNKKGTRVLLKMRDLPVGEHRVVVGGVDVGAFTVVKDGARAKLRLSTNPGKKDLPLAVDPSGVTVEVRDASDALLLAADLP